MIDAKIKVSKKILLLDNFDSFTHILADYFLQLGADLVIMRNNVLLEEITCEDFKAVILSPGPGKPNDSGVMSAVIQYYHNRLPMLGICLGHQALGEFFGAELVHAKLPMHGKISGVQHNLKSPIFKEIPASFDVVRYHSLVLQALTTNLEAIATTADGEIMALRHLDFPIYGLQFHPEAALTEHGLKLLSNWLNMYSLVC